MSESVKMLMDAMSQFGIAAAAKEEVVFDQAFLHHHQTVFRVARSIVQDSGLAEDVTQEVFLRLYKNLDSITDQEMLRPWLIRVAINLAKNTLRTKIRANTRDEKYVQQTAENSVSSVESAFEQRAQIKEIDRALQMIKEPLRSCLVLKKQGLSYKEIAASLSLNESSIGTFIARARKEFVRHYDSSGGNYER